MRVAVLVVLITCLLGSNLILAASWTSHLRSLRPIIKAGAKGARLGLDAVWQIHSFQRLTAETVVDALIDHIWQVKLACVLYPELRPSLIGAFQGVAFPKRITVKWIMRQIDRLVYSLSVPNPQSRLPQFGYTPID